MATEQREPNIDPIPSENEQTGEGSDMASRVSKVANLQEMISLLEEMKQIPGERDIKYEADDLISRIELAVSQVEKVKYDEEFLDDEVREEHIPKKNMETEINRIKSAFPATYGLRDKIVELLKGISEDDIGEIWVNLSEKNRKLAKEEYDEIKAAKELYGEDVYRQKVEEI